MQQTSLDAYFVDVKPKLNEKQTQVFRAIEAICPASNKQIANYLGWPINSVTPRVLELRQKRQVRSAYVADDGGRKAHFWATNAVAEQYFDEVR